jgi:CRISPR-associated endonuclease Csn1
MAGVVERLRFAFDMGTNSIGWAVYRLDAQGRPCELVACGVRIFSDGRNPKDGSSLAAMRRGPRAARRRRDRFIQRRDWLMMLLVRHGLMPEDREARKSLEALDPYALRGRALETPVEPFEIGRALFHLNQRRGYKSNRVTDSRGDDKDKGKIAAAGEQLRKRLAAEGFLTLGQFYASRQAGPVRRRQGVRARLNGEGVKATYDFYPQRDMVEEEFDRIWAGQAAHHPALMTEEARTSIRAAMFHQRPLKPPAVGRCTFFPEEFRLAQAHPVAQRFRIYQELANIEIKEGLARPRRLTLPERDRLAAPLLAGEDLTFGKIRRLLDLGGAAEINLEEGGRDRLKGDASAARLGGRKGALRRLWPDLSEAQRAETIERLLDETDGAALQAWLAAELGASAEEAEAAARFRPPEGHIRLGPTAARGVVEALWKGDPDTSLTIRYHEALQRAFPDKHHSDFRDGEILDRLPDYREVLGRHTIGGTGDPADARDKRLGRVPNPTVHIGLNQLRRVVNALIDLYGPPTQVVLELARELKQTKDQKDKARRENRKNGEANRRRAEDLDAADLPVTPQNLRLYRLWEDLGPLPRVCTYTGRVMSFDDVFSDRVEIEHILPFSRTLDDSMANKTLAYRDANRGKRNLTPEEADWSSSVGGYDAIQQRAAALPHNKRWRFLPGAMERFEDKERGFLDRQLNETRYLSRLAREYVGKVADPDNVWVVTGQLTALLRARWGLNFSNVKNRDNHRHHAIDAATVGVTDRSLLNELATRAGRREWTDDLQEVVKDVPQPPGFVAAGRDFRNDVREKVQALIVSHKTEHGLGGALHEDTAYGLVDPGRGEDGNLVYRKPLDVLTAAEVRRIRDLDLRARLMRWLNEKAAEESDKAGWRAALREFAKEQNVHRVRLLKKEDGAILVRDRRTGKPYKAMIGGENAYMDVVEGADGAWRGHAVSRFDANRKDFVPAWTQEVGSRVVMRLFKGDMVELADDDGQRRTKRVVRINPSAGRLYLAAHDEAGELAKRHEDPEDPFRWDLASISRLKARGCRRVGLDVLGL